MRELERGVLLQIIDERWREHLYDMDYLREGIHLRGFAQRDPLVEYKNEGFALFRDLMNSIWEDFGRYIFHVQVQIEPAQAAAMSRRSSTSGVRGVTYSGGGPEQPSALYDAAEQAGVATMEPDGAGVCGAARGRDPSRRGPRQDRPQRPVLVRLGQEVQEVPRGVRLRVADQVQVEQIPERVAKLRDQLKLLADYL